MNLSGKLELTWTGKEDKIIVEPRLLIEDKSKTYGVLNSGNMLIHGDNLIALKALQKDFAGEIKCIYVDPPFNTGAAFEYYDDHLEHSIWLNLMYNRFKLLHCLLKEDGVIFVNLDDCEAAYAKIILDEIFGRKNYLNEIIVATNKSFGFKSTSDGIFKQANHLLFYAKDKQKFVINSSKLFIEKSYDPQYKWIFCKTHLDESEWTWENINDIVARNMGYSSLNEAKKDPSFMVEVSNFAIENADRVFRTASVSGGALLKRKETIQLSKLNKKTIMRHPDDDMDYMFIGGERVIFYRERLKKIDGVMVPGELITDIWNDISVEGLAAEGGIDFPKGKKPEKLIQRCIELTTQEGDYVLDSFLGSGTTAAVAMKLNRRFIGIELGDQCYTHCYKRLKSVIDGEQSGISKSVNWIGGGGFGFYELSEPLFVKHPILGIHQVNPIFDSETLQKYICHIEGYAHVNKGLIHGYSTEKHYIHITKEFVNGEIIQQLMNLIDDNESISIYALKYQSDLRLPENIEIIDIMKKVLPKCINVKE